MAIPVVVSRIQNRRGTQDQFNGPAGIYPLGYNGVGGFNPPGTGPVGFTSAAYPNVLLPGELAFCTDSRRVYLGNINGEFVELSAVSGDNTYQPSVWVLPPSATYTPVTKTLPGPVTVTLEYYATPYFSIKYDVTDSLAADWNTTGTNYARNGELRITAVGNFAPIPNPPFPDTVPVSLVDTCSEVNLTAYSLQFSAQYNFTNIEILYKHNFPGSLTFSTSTISWVPF